MPRRRNGQFVEGGITVFGMTKSVSAAVLLARVSRSVGRWHSSGNGIPDMLFAYNRWGDWWPFPITADSEDPGNHNKLSAYVRSCQKKGSMKAYVLVISGKFSKEGRGKSVRGKKLTDGVLAVCWAPGSCGPFTKAGRTWRFVEKDGGRELQETCTFVAKRGRKDEIETWLDAPIAERRTRSQ